MAAQEEVTAVENRGFAGCAHARPGGRRQVLVMDVETLEELTRDIPVAAVHIGMLADRAVAAAVAGFLEERRPPNVVLDPVLRSSSGAVLLEPKGAAILVERLLPLATVVTPNIDEAAYLTGLSVKNPDQMRAAAGKLHSMGAANVVVTGGHLERAIDVLGFLSPAGAFEFEVFQSPRLETTSTHGTGCAFATALAYYDGYRSARLPANLLQAQRDYFGAHTYQRTDKPGVFHSDWIRLRKQPK